jgi:hypothetical protein
MHDRLFPRLHDPIDAAFIIASIACPLARQEKTFGPFTIVFSDFKMMDVLFSR